MTYRGDIEPVPGYQSVADRIIDKWNQKGKAQRCPLCAANAWVVGHYVPLSTSLIPTGWVYPYTTQNSSIYPCVTVFCSNCGNVQLLNLLILGFTDEELPSLRLPPL